MSKQKKEQASDTNEPRFVIHTPSPIFTQCRHGVYFRDGKGETDSQKIAAIFVECGYQVTDRESEAVINPLARLAKAEGKAPVDSPPPAE